MFNVNNSHKGSKDGEKDVHNLDIRDMLAHN